MTFPCFPTTSPDFLGIDLKGENTGSVLAQLRRNFGNTFEHLGENKLSALVRLFDRRVHDLLGNTLNFDIHLNRRNAVDRSCDFKIHIAEEVFQSLNIGQNPEFARFLIFDESHRNACDGALIGTPASMSAIVEPQTEAMEDEPLEERMSFTTRIA